MRFGALFLLGLVVLSGCAHVGDAQLMGGSVRLEVVRAPAVCGPMGFRRTPLQGRWGEYVKVTVSSAATLRGTVLVHADGTAREAQSFEAAGEGALVIDARFENPDPDARFALQREQPIDITLTGLEGVCDGAVFTVEHGALVPNVDDRAWIAELERRGGPELAARRAAARREAEARRQAHYAAWASRRTEVSAEAQAHAERVRQAHYAAWDARRAPPEVQLVASISTPGLSELVEDGPAGQSTGLDVAMGGDASSSQVGLSPPPLVAASVQGGVVGGGSSVVGAAPQVGMQGGLVAGSSCASGNCGASAGTAPSITAQGGLVTGGGGVVGAAPQFGLEGGPGAGSACPGGSCGGAFPQVGADAQCPSGRCAPAVEFPSLGAELAMHGALVGADVVGPVAPSVTVQGDVVHAPSVGGAFGLELPSVSLDVDPFAGLSAALDAHAAALDAVTVMDVPALTSVGLGAELALHCVPLTEVWATAYVPPRVAVQGEVVSNVGTQVAAVTAHASSATEWAQPVTPSLQPVPVSRESQVASAGAQVVVTAPPPAMEIAVPGVLDLMLHLAGAALSVQLEPVHGAEPAR